MDSGERYGAGSLRPFRRIPRRLAVRPHPDATEARIRDFEALRRRQQSGTRAGGPAVNPDLLDTEDAERPDDPFRYGWRYVPGSDDPARLVRVPLTLEDILHPREEDFRVHSQSHVDDVNYLREALGLLVADDPTAVVLADCRLAWDAAGTFAHGPDVALVRGVAPRPDWDWSTFNVVEEKARPSLIVEVVSPETRSTDVVDKVAEYHAQKVPWYVIADTRYRKGRRVSLSLIGQRWAPDGYDGMAPDDRGRLWLEAVPAWLGTVGLRLVLYRPDGTAVGTYREQARGREVAEEQAALARARAAEEAARAAAEAARADSAEARVRELEAMIRRLQGGS
jgi:Uma2 family endonuclease